MSRTEQTGPQRSADAAGLPELFAPTAQRVDRAIVEALDDWLTAAPAELAEAVRYAMLGPGKRIRPVLLLWSAQVCGDDAGAVSAAVALEMLHTYSLVHDDLPGMDDDALRRGRPTCHVAFGEGVAILVGDALLTRAFEQIALSPLPAERVVALVRTLSEAAGAAGMIGGQADDLAHENAPGDLAAVESIHARKTAALLSAACRMGAIAAGAAGPVEQALARFGHALGLAFQIADDLLDELGQADQVGKKTQKDRQAGKLTYPAVAGVEASRRAAADWLAEAEAALDRLATLLGPQAGGRLDDFRSLGRFVIERTR